MGKKLIYTFVFVFGFLFSGNYAQAQIPEDIIISIKAGNSATLARHFNQNVELVVLENENVYSKAHAQQVIQDFFSKNKPVSFSIIHKADKGDLNYAIGTLKTENGQFRVYFLIKKINNVSFIHQLRIEQQSK
ncbi:MAG: DUF4783 domain-containing protein [Prolixibacteraceae bacterium]|nr:DUF4783 domain-containing protein [Prolixibacteraceae bacterium]